MTREHRLVVSLDEIAAVRWQCPQCHVAISYALTETIRIPDQCPACHELLDGAHQDATTAARALVQALKAAIRTAAPLRLEFRDEPAS
jgi:hypothetical protein